MRFSYDKFLDLRDIPYKDYLDSELVYKEPLITPKNKILKIAPDIHQLFKAGQGDEVAWRWVYLQNQTEDNFPSIN